MKQAKSKILFSILLCCVLAMGALGFAIIWPQNNPVDANVLELSNQTATTSLSALNFTLINGGSEYKVGIADKSAVEVVIPSEYNNKAVTEIADNGFMTCQALEKVFVPSSIKRIGNNAFMLSRNLKRVVGMAGVTSIGNSAFNMCTSLENLKLPEGIVSLGTSVIKNIPNAIYARATQEKMASLNPNWNYDGNIIYGNTIAYSKYPNDTDFVGYQIDPWQLLSPSNEPLTIYSWCYADENDSIGAPLVNIGQGAFSMFDVPSIVIKHPDGSNLNHKINIESFAFSSVITDHISIETDMEIKDPDAGISTSLFWDSKTRFITLPDSIDSIPDLCFSQCVNLEEIKSCNSEIEINHLSNKILSIGIEAFDQCYSLPKLYINKNIEQIGDNAFKRWGTNPNETMPMQNIYIDTISEGENWGQLWNNDYNTERCNIEFTGATEYAVNFIVDQENVVFPQGNSTIVVEPKSTLQDIKISPISESHDFSGVWYTTKERTPGTEFALDREINKNLELYAGWDIKHFDKLFENSKYLNFYDAQNGELITGKTIKFEYGQIFQFYILVNNGYENVSIHHGKEIVLPNTGNIYTITIKDETLIKINADLIEYKISYNNLRNGLNPENNPQTYTVETPTITFAAPQWEAYNNATWDLPMLTQGSWGNRIISAIWTNPVVYSINYECLREGNNQ